MVAAKFFVTVCPPPSRAKTGPAIEMARTVHAAAIMARNFMRFLPLLTSRFSVFMPPSLPARAALLDAPGHGRARPAHEENGRSRRARGLRRSRSGCAPKIGRAHV